MKVIKCSSLAPPRSLFCKTQWAWQGVKWSWLISIFTSKNVWKFLIIIQPTKSNPKIISRVNRLWLMPIRVNLIWNWLLKMAKIWSLEPNFEDFCDFSNLKTERSACFYTKTHFILMLLYSFNNFQESSLSKKMP